MQKLVVRCYTHSLDGFSAGLNQSLNNPFGEDAMKLMNWALATQTFKKMFGQTGGSTGIDDQYASVADVNVGATIMGRNMFSPDRGPWPNEDWKGWWGEEPPYHHPVIVLTHHPRPAFELKGGTNFTFVTDGLESGLKQAFAAAKGKDVRIGGGASTVKQCWKAGLIDELHLVQAPILMGKGEKLFEGLEGIEKLYTVTEVKQGEGAVHVRITKN